MNFDAKTQLMLFVFFYSCNIVIANWLESCKPCVDTLKSWKKCSTQNECITCANDYSHIQCSKCYTDVFHEKILYCDHKQSQEFQDLACGVKCRVENLLEWICISKNGECTCGTHDFILLQLLESLILNLRNISTKLTKLKYISIWSYILIIVPLIISLIISCF